MLIIQEKKNNPTSHLTRFFKEVWKIYNFLCKSLLLFWLSFNSQKIFNNFLCKNMSLKSWSAFWYILRNTINRLVVWQLNLSAAFLRISRVMWSFSSAEALCACWQHMPHVYVHSSELCCVWKSSVNHLSEVFHTQPHIV